MNEPKELREAREAIARILHDLRESNPNWKDWEELKLRQKRRYLGRAIPILNLKGEGWKLAVIDSTEQISFGPGFPDTKEGNYSRVIGEE